MPVDGAALGARWADWVGAVDARWLMAHAAGVGRTDPGAYDTERGVVGHPLFPVAPEWALVTAEGAGLEALGLDADEAARGVHATHDLHLHRPLAPTARVTLRAHVAGITQTRAGALVTQRFDAHDVAGPLWTTWMGSLYRGVEVAGTGGWVGEVPDPPAALVVPDMASDAAAGARVEVPVWAAHVYTACARIWNPIHTDVAFARAAGLDGVILHGTAVLAHGVDHALRTVGAASGQVRRLGGSFRAMVPVPSTLTCVVTGVVPDVADPAVRTVHLQVRTAEGSPAVRDGYVVVGP